MTRKIVKRSNFLRRRCLRSSVSCFFARLEWEWRQAHGIACPGCATALHARAGSRAAVAFILRTAPRRQGIFRQASVGAGPVSQVAIRGHFQRTTNDGAAPCRVREGARRVP